MLGLGSLLLQEPHKAPWFPFSGLSTGITPPPGFSPGAWKVSQDLEWGLSGGDQLN